MNDIQSVSVKEDIIFKIGNKNRRTDIRMRAPKKRGSHLFYIVKNGYGEIVF